MTDRTQNMLGRWAPTLLSAVALIGTLALFAMRSTAQAEGAPLDKRVAVLEAQRAEDVGRLGRIEATVGRVESKVDRILTARGERTAANEP